MNDERARLRIAITPTAIRVRSAERVRDNGFRAGATSVEPVSVGAERVRYDPGSASGAILGSVSASGRKRVADELPVNRRAEAFPSTRQKRANEMTVARILGTDAIAAPSASLQSSNKMGAAIVTPFFVARRRMPIAARWLKKYRCGISPVS